MNTRNSLLTLFLAAIVFVGCSSPDSRIKDHQSSFDRLSESDKGKVRGGHVDVGFTSEMVLMALGEPDRRYSRTTATGTDEVWAYSDRGSGLSIGIGVGGGSGHMGGGVGVSTGNDRRDDKVRIIIQGDRVIAIERRG
jgi:hypothetical protein